MVFVNEGGFIGSVLSGLTNLTGSLFLTLFCLMIVLIVIALAIGLPIETISIIYLPILIAYASYSSDYMAIFGATLIYTGILIAKYLFSR